eukprot:gene3026-590_t
MELALMENCVQTLALGMVFATAAAASVVMDGEGSTVPDVMQILHALAMEFVTTVLELVFATAILSMATELSFLRCRVGGAIGKAVTAANARPPIWALRTVRVKLVTHVFDTEVGYDWAELWQADSTGEWHSVLRSSGNGGPSSFGPEFDIASQSVLLTFDSDVYVSAPGFCIDEDAKVECLPCLMVYTTVLLSNSLQAQLQNLGDQQLSDLASAGADDVVDSISLAPLDVVDSTITTMSDAIIHVLLAVPAASARSTEALLRSALEQGLGIPATASFYSEIGLSTTDGQVLAAHAEWSRVQTDGGMQQGCKLSMHVPIVAGEIHMQYMPMSRGTKLSLVEVSAHDMLCVPPHSRSGSVQLYNMGTHAVDLSNWQLCTSKSCTLLAQSVLLAGKLILRPFSVVMVILSMADSAELALYRPGTVGFAGTMVHYVSFETAQRNYEFLHLETAVRKGIWLHGERVPMGCLFFSGLHPLSAGIRNWNWPTRLQQVDASWNRVTVTNPSCFPVDVADMVLSYGGLNLKLVSARIISGQHLLQPGASVVYQVIPRGIPYEAALWAPGSGTTEREWFGSLVHYVRWASPTTSNYEALAIQAQMWLSDEFLEDASVLSSWAYAGRLAGPSNWANPGVDQIRVLTIDPTAFAIELLNTGSSAADVSNMCLCSSSTCRLIKQLNVASHHLAVLRRIHKAQVQQQQPFLLQPGASVVYVFPPVQSDCDEIGLYRSEHQHSLMVHYVKWGSAACLLAPETSHEKAAISGALWGESQSVSSSSLIHRYRPTDGSVTGLKDWTVSGSIVGDPHFQSFSGGSYQVRAVPGEVFSIISARHFFFNARFVGGPLGSTYIGAVMIAFNGHCISWDAAGAAPVLDGQVMDCDVQYDLGDLYGSSGFYFAASKKSSSRTNAILELAIRVPGYHIDLTR